jgi:rubredoxin
MKSHKCSSCQYVYLTDCKTEKSGYNPLVDDYTTVSINEQRHCCAYEPGGVVLDYEQPRCSHYERC